MSRATETISLTTRFSSSGGFLMVKIQRFAFGLGIVVVAALALAVGSARRAEALTLPNSATVPGTAAADRMINEVRGGGHGGGHGGFHGGGHGGFRGGHGGGFRGGHFGGFRHGGFRRGHFGGYHRGGYHRGHRYGYRGYGYRHRGYGYRGYGWRHHHRCRIVWTYYGPRRVCRWYPWYGYYW